MTRSTREPLWGILWVVSCPFFGHSYGLSSGTSNRSRDLRRVFVEVGLRRVLHVPHGHLRAGVPEEFLEPDYGHARLSSHYAVRVPKIVERGVRLRCATPVVKARRQAGSLPHSPSGVVGIPVVAGRAAVRDWVDRFLKDCEIQMATFTIDDRAIGDTVAFCRWTATGAYQRRNGESYPFDQKYLDTFVKDSDGTWRFAIHMWSPNTNDLGVWADYP